MSIARREQQLGFKKLSHEVQAKAVDIELMVLPDDIPVYLDDAEQFANELPDDFESKGLILKHVRFCRFHMGKGNSRKIKICLFNIAMNLGMAKNDAQFFKSEIGRQKYLADNVLPAHRWWATQAQQIQDNRKVQRLFGLNELAGMLSKIPHEERGKDATQGYEQIRNILRKEEWRHIWDVKPNVK